VTGGDTASSMQTTRFIGCRILIVQPPESIFHVKDGCLCKEIRLNRTRNSVRLKLKQVWVEKIVPLPHQEIHQISDDL